ncbi:hypothetical protein [Marinactinospora rubrisoli]|uniref:Secreted protein n=1 Tax=Marinactinospora rubrisoli TaxID=2715399 RepID=A0ABW2KDA2_9ACTN
MRTSIRTRAALVAAGLGLAASAGLALAAPAAAEPGNSWTCDRVLHDRPLGPAEGVGNCVPDNSSARLGEPGFITERYTGRKVRCEGVDGTDAPDIVRGFRCLWSN